MEYIGLNRVLSNTSSPNHRKQAVLSVVIDSNGYVQFSHRLIGGGKVVTIELSPENAKLLAEQLGEN